MKDRSGLSLAALATRTGISRSSWERYLNGKALPTSRAVEELARVTGADPTRLLVLRDVAEEAWRQQVAPGRDDPEVENPVPDWYPAGGTTGSAQEPAASAGRSTGLRKPVAFAAVTVAALIGMGAGMLIAMPWDDGDDGGGSTKVNAVAETPEPSPSSSTSAPANGLGPYIFKAGKTYPCKVRRTDEMDGGLAAGYSVTRTAVLAGPGWDVVEAQCLLLHHKMKPGTIDGVYGQQTIAAVMQLQEKAELPADGIIGPHTWRVLRG